MQLYENIVQLHLESLDGEKYNTNVTDIQGLFRIIRWRLYKVKVIKFQRQYR